MPRSLIALLVVAVLAGTSASLVRADPTADEARLQALLDRTKISVAVEQAEFGQVVKQLQVQTGLNLVIDPRIESDVYENIVTGLHAVDLPLATILDMLAHTAGEEVVWRIRGNTIIFSNRWLLRDPLEVRIYPVAALTAARTEFVPPRRGLVGFAEETADYEGIYPFGMTDELIELIKSAVEPHFWEETEGADVRTMGEGRLVVRASARVHQAIDRFLAHLANLSTDAVQIEIHAVASTQLPEAAGATLTAEQANAVFASEAAGPALCLAVREGIQSTAYAGTRRVYVAGYDARFAGGASTLDPRVDVLDLGMAARIRALPSPEGDRVLLKLDVAIAEATADHEHGSDAQEKLPLPGRTIVRRDGVLLLKPATWHWTEGRTGGTDAGRWGFLVRATPVRSVPATDGAAQAFAIPSPIRVPQANPLHKKRFHGLSFEEAGLDQVAAYVRTLTGLNVFITPRLRAEVFDEVEINLHLDDVAVSTVLDLVTEPYELTWRFADNLITIDVKHDRYRQMVLRYFDVKDLAERVAPARVRPTPDPIWNEEAEEPSPIYPEEALVDLIRETIGGEAEWEDPATIEVRNRILIARNTGPILDTIARLLQGLRASQELVVTTVDQIEIGSASLAKVLATTDGCPLLLDAAAQARLEAAVAAGTATRLSRERIVSVEGSGTPKATGEEIPYVADYDVARSDENDASAPVRRVASLHLGTKIASRAIPGYPGRHVYLELVFERTRLQEMGEAKTPHGSLDLPTLRVWRVATGLRVPEDHAAVVSATQSGGIWRFLVVTPKRVPLEAK